MTFGNTKPTGIIQPVVAGLKPLRQAAAALAVAAVLFGAGLAEAKVATESLTYHEEALEFLKKGDINAAIIQFKNAIRADPNNVQARFDLAVIYLRGRDGPSAEKELKAARDRGMDADKIWLPLARAYSLQRKNQEILDEIVPDKQTGLLKANMLAARGAAYAAMKQLDGAEAALDEAVKEAPDSPFVLLAYSQVLQARGKYKEAEAQVDRVLTIEPDNQQALLRKGSMLQSRKDFAAAIETYDKVVAANESNIPALLARASGYMALNQDEKAKQDVTRAIQVAPKNPIARYMDALLLARERKYQEAVDVLQPVQQALSGYPPSLYLAASLDFAQGRIEQAQTSVQAYLTMVPDSPRGLRMLAAIHLRKRAPAKAIEILEPMVQASPDEVNLLTMLGNAYVAVGRNAEATELFEKVASTDPENSSIRTRLALTKLNTGDKDAAVKEFESILQDNPDETQASLLLVLTHLRNKDYGAAKQSAEVLKTRMPKSPIPDNFLGTIFLGLRDVENARTHFAKALEIQPDFSPAALNLAEIDRSAGRTEEARTRYEKILENDKKHLQAMLRLAQLAFASQNNEAGFDWLRRAIQANPKSIRPRIVLVNALLTARENQRALNTSRELVQIAPKNPDALDALARSQIAADKLPSAVSTYRQLTKLAPRSAVVFHRFARALMASKDFAGAATALDEAIALDPNLLAARQDRVAVALQEEGPEAALTLATAMTEEAPDKDYGYVLQGDVHMRNDKPVDAAKAYQEALKRNPTSRTASRLYQSLSRSGNTVGARTSLEVWLENYPEDTAIRFMYASDLIRGSQFMAAIRENEILLKKFPNNAVLLNDLAWLYGQVQDDRALGYAEQAYKLAPKTPAIADTLGWLLVEKGETKKGLTYLRQAHEGAPDQLEIGYHYAAALAKDGQESQAIKILRDVLDTGKKFSLLEDARKLYATLASR